MTAARIKSLRSDLDRRLGKLQHLEARLADEERIAGDLEAKAESLTSSIEILQAATESRRQELKDRVESLVTRGLRAVFEREDYEFLFRVTFARDVMGVIPVLRSSFGDKEVEAEIEEGHGGGVADVVSFLLRVVVLSLSRPRSAPFMVLDESFKHVSPEFLRGVASLLKELNDSAGIQFLLVTHKAELLDAADVIYRIGLVDGRSKFTCEHDMRDESYHARPSRGGVRRSTSTPWDHDMTSVGPEVESVLAKTDDPQALRQRRRLKGKRGRGK